MNKANFKTLLEKYLTGNLSSAEKKQLLKWLEQPDYQNLLRAHMKLEFQAGVYEGEEDPAIFESVQKQLQQKIFEPEKDTPISRLHFNKVRMLRTVAAAALIIIVISAALFYKKDAAHNSMASSKVIATTKAVLPGHEGAIITLADGTQLFLDSAQNGVLQQQGNTQIVKRSGQIAYLNQQGTANALLYNTMTTTRGRQYSLVLNDGTKVWLNAASSIRFPTAFTEHTRNVAITGEVYFEVAKNPHQPFMVTLPDGGTIEVLGTHFNVMAYSNETASATTLLEGSIKMQKAGANTILEPGQQAQVKGDQIEVIPKADVDLAVAWKNGFTSFRKADIQTIMRQVGRWYDVDVTYNGNIPERKFSGDLPREAPITDVFKIFKESDIHFELEGSKVIVTP